MPMWNKGRQTAIRLPQSLEIGYWQQYPISNIHFLTQIFVGSNRFRIIE